MPSPVEHTQPEIENDIDQLVRMFDGSVENAAKFAVGCGHTYYLRGLLPRLNVSEAEKDSLLADCLLS